LTQLEKALAGPIQSGLVTLVEGRIGIRGSVLFRFGSADLTPEGRTLLAQLVPPLSTYLDQRGEALMVSGFTDDVPAKYGADYADNWELSAQRALSVTRALIGHGVAPGHVFAAGFGEQHPVAPNATAEQRALN